MAQPRARSLKAHQHVEWDASQGVVEGTVERTITKPTKIKNYVAKASPTHPEVLVKSTKTGALAAHLPEELRPARARKRKK